MATLNKIPKTGTYGTAVDAMNENFTLIQQSLAEGYSPYQVWLDQGNEGTEQDFLDSLKGADGVSIGDNFTVLQSLSALDGKSESEKEAMVTGAKAVEELTRDVFGGDETLNEVTVHTGFVSNGNVGGTSRGYWATYSGFSSKIYDVTSYSGRTLQVTGGRRAQSYNYIFCRDYESIPVNADAYNADPTLWIGNVISCSSARGTSGNTSYANNALVVPDLPEDAQHVYLILAQYTPGSYLASAKTGIVGALPGKQDVLTWDTEPTEESVNPVTSGGLYNTIHPLHEEVEGYDGAIETLYVKTGKVINSNGSNIGYWVSWSGWNSYVFDVSGRVGQQVKVKLRRRANTIMYAFVRDYEDITDSLDSTAWAANKVSSAKSSPNNTSAGYVEYTLTVPDEAVHLVLTGTADFPAKCIYPENVEMGMAEIREIVEDWVGSSGTIEALNPSKEYLPKIKQMVHQRYNSTAPKWKTVPLLLAHFSDVHANGAALSRMIGWCSQYNDIADILHTGDAVSETLDDGMAFWDNAGAENVLNIVGNHDASLEDAPSQGTAPVADIYNALFAPYINNWAVIQPEDAAANGLLYWYKDYATKKVRLIGLDCMHKTSAQLAWLEGVLVDAADKGLTVVIAYHSGPASDGTFTKLSSCNFCDSTVTSGAYAYAWPTLEAKVTAFKSGELEGQTATGDFACWLCGHSHKDYLLWTDSGQLIVGIDALTTGISGRTHAIREGEKSQDLFNLVGIDTYRHTVKLLRVGSDIDDQLRKIDQCAIDYTTGKVLGQPTASSGGGEQADWNESDNTSAAYIKNKPTIPTVPTNVSAFNNDAGYLTSHQDMSGKEDRVSVGTINGTSLSASIGTYYVGSSVGTLAVTLPTVSDSTHIANVVLNMAMGTSPSVTFAAASGVAISYSKDFTMEASKEYEVNCLWNGTKWLITAVEFETPTS